MTAAKTVTETPDINPEMQAERLCGTFDTNPDNEIRKSLRNIRHQPWVMQAESP
jgi:hypothetical protein